MADEGNKQNSNMKLFEIIEYNGLPIYKCDMDRIVKLRTFEDDVFICSFPRSGTTVTQEMTYLIQTLDFETASSVYLNDRVPWIDGEEQQIPTFRSVDAVEELVRPRAIKCHLPFEFLPNDLQQGKGKIIYTSRNPKDVAQSFYRLGKSINLLPKEQTTIGQYVDDFVQGKVPLGRWTNHVLSYWNRRDCSNILFLKYEETIKDVKCTVKRIADFLGRQLTDDDVMKISQHCDVNNMRENPMTNLTYTQKYMNVREEVGKFINTGKAGVWREVLTPEMSAKIDGMMKPLDGTGLQYDFQ